MAKKNLIALTGGGTAGHVMPHVAMLPFYQEQGLSVLYIGSAGIEREIMAGTGVSFHEIAAGKLRRYFSMKNFFDVFKVGLGCIQAFWILARHRPRLVFSKGGFVSVPVAIAAWMLKIPVLSHESDLTPGLANRIISRFASRILYSFPQTEKFVPKAISRYVGVPIRDELFRGDRKTGLSHCGFGEEGEAPVVLVMGGSLGAQRINDALLGSLPVLTRSFRVIHITGRGKGIDFSHPRYKAFEYVGPELKDIFAASDYVVSRAGANSIFEFLALKKPMLLIPLEVGSRGDQVHNAECFAENGWALVLREATLSSETLESGIASLVAKAEAMRSAQTSSEAGKATERILEVIREFS